MGVRAVVCGSWETIGSQVVIVEVEVFGLADTEGTGKGVFCWSVDVLAGAVTKD